MNSRMNKKEINKDCIEMQEKGDTGTVRITSEENRMIIPREVKNIQYLLNKNSLIKKYNWDTDGTKIVKKDKLYFSKEEKKMIKYLLLKKMPESLRPDFWLIASGARREIKNNPNYYKDITENFPECIPSPYENQIQMDLHRTFPGDPFFVKEENIEKLRNLLLAYSRRNISIGYCQGFNFIAARLLKTFKNEEEAFWVFVQLIEHILPIDYYSELAGIMVDCAILLKLIKIYLPSLHNHLVEIGYELSLNNVLYKWFVSIFIQNLSEDLSYIIWDLVMLEGNLILFKAALGVLKIIKNSVLAKETMEDINHVFDYETKHLNDHYTLIYYIVFRKFDFDYDLICRHRKLFQSTIVENINKNNEHRKSKYVDNNRESKRKASYVKHVVECFRDWPLCIYDWSYKYNIVNHLVFRVFDPPNFIDDYFFENVNSGDYVYIKRKCSKSSDGFQKANYFDSGFLFDSKCSDNMVKISSSGNSPKLTGAFSEDTEDKMRTYKNLLIERRPHICPEKAKITITGDQDHEVLYNTNYELTDNYVKLKDESEFEICESEHSDSVSSSKRRSQSMMKPFFKVKMENTDSSLVNYSKVLNDLSAKEDLPLFDTFKPKSVFDIEEF